MDSRNLPDNVLPVPTGAIVIRGGQEPDAVRRGAPAEPDVLAQLLADKRSPATRRAYQSDLTDFFGAKPSQETVRAFLTMPTGQIALRLTQYKAGMLAKGLSEATINRRLAAVRSLLKFTHRLGISSTDGRGLVDGEKSRSYRDTRGITPAQTKLLLSLPDRKTIQGLRDYAMLKILFENVLRRGEVAALNVADFSLSSRTLYILGKGRGSQKEPVTLSDGGATAVAAYLLAAGHASSPGAALFQNVSRNTDHKGGRLTGSGIYEIVKGYGLRAGIERRLTPHQARHTGITAAIKATKGDLERVQKLSRHRDVRTVMIYNDNQANLQAGVTDLLEKMFE